jgi:competence protein ComEC
MRIFDVVFYGIVFFLLGVLAASLKLSFSTITAASLLIAVFILLFAFLKNSSKLFWLAGLFLFAIVGSFYYFQRENFQLNNLKIPFNQKTEFVGLISSEPEKGANQRLVVDLKEPYRGGILIKTASYPVYAYGDLIKFEGVVKNPEPESYANYLAKDGILGIANFPKIELVAENQGSKIKSALFKLKEKIIAVFQKTLPSEEAAFLSGIVLGERAEFSKEFKEAMSNSGTTHLVALSGYNITILAMAIANSLGCLFSRRPTFYLTLLVMVCFVLMTGAEASVVRAAIMGGILLLAKQIGRLYSFRNAIAVAAFLMVLDNPKILNFDIGFQLSFLALLGIVYLMPAVQKFFRLSEEPGVLSWRGNLLTTFSAQTAVAPLLITYFGNFSPISLLANVLILALIPVTMALGFILGALGFLSYHLALVFGWFVNLFLTYETFVIKFFGGLDTLKINSLSIALAIVYYVILAAFMFYASISTKLNQIK